ncbi:hypothetical protein AVEN_159466-1 [Araneus ventricosus]|uniref:Uncharacterized protein n=1 Tax=Araneus ventricosus TaxID=182803 RepID=A0A4Y2A156_ARAVE|nr:hypothetical protein AVEN_159466-1 [Araneus ventricosus]
MVKLDSNEIREHRPKDKPMFDTRMACEDQLDLLTSARAETANNVCERRLPKERGFQFHRHLYSFEPGDLVLYDWPKQCKRKFTPMFKGPFVIVRPVGPYARRSSL